MLIPTLVAVHAALSFQTEPTADLQDAAATPAVAETAPAAVDPGAPARLEPPRLFEDLDDQAVLARATAAIEGIDTLRARFVQTSPTGNVTEGVVSMDRPGRLRFDYDAPSTQEIVATGGLVYVHDKDLQTTDSYPVSQTPLRFLLAEAIETEGVVLTGVSRREGEVAVSLQATDDDLSGEVALVFEGEEDALTLSRWAVVDPQGGITLVELSDVETGVSLSNRLFRIPERTRRFGNDRR